MINVINMIRVFGKRCGTSAHLQTCDENSALTKMLVKVAKNRAPNERKRVPSSPNPQSQRCNLRPDPVELEQVRTASTRSCSRSFLRALSCPKNHRCLSTPSAQVQLSPPLAQRLLLLPLAHLPPCQTLNFLLRHQLRLIPPSSLDESDSYCSIPEHGYQAKRIRADSPRSSPLKMFNRIVYPHHG